MIRLLPLKTVWDKTLPCEKGNSFLHYFESVPLIAVILFASHWLLLRNLKYRHTGTVISDLQHHGMTVGIVQRIPDNLIIRSGVVKA